MPRPVAVELGSNRQPAAVGGHRVDTVREDWVVEDRWWTDAPIRRRYFELVLEDGRNVVVFRQRGVAGWHAQRS